MKVAVVLGAGFSYVGGVPLTKDLFEAQGGLPRAQGQSVRADHAEVLASYSRWKVAHPSETAEQWLAELYSLRDHPLQEMKQGTTWKSAIRFALSRLVELPPGRNTHYYYGICNYKCHPTHRQFWERIERDFEEPCIVTLNYDIMVEQALHQIASKHRTAPRCYYGGFQYIQGVRKMTDVTKRSYELVQMGNEFTLYKLHGSLNWAWEPHSPTLKIHQDVRAVFRSDDKFGVPAIIPPIPEKEMPAEFAQVWNEAHISLSKCPTWIICGYSLPPYDFALCDFFSKTRGQAWDIAIWCHPQGGWS